MTRVVLVVVALFAPGCGGPAPASSPAALAPSELQPVQVGELVVAGMAALEAGDFLASSALARQVLQRSDVASQDRAEATRILGLSMFFRGDRAGAERVLLEYLRLAPDAHLDPALFAPEVVVFFEDLRARHRATLRALRPEPKPSRSIWLNALPAAGQFQNGESGKAWWIVAGLSVTVAANVATYALLNAKCDAQDRTCDVGGANGLWAVNLFSGLGALGIYAYSVFDGVRGYRRLQARDRGRIRVTLGFGDNDAIVLLGTRF